MITQVDERLRREVADFSLRFDCEHCAHFDSQTAGCANGYPNDAHRGADLKGRRELTFCKEFELA